MKDEYDFGVAKRFDEEKSHVAKTIRERLKQSKNDISESDNIYIYIAIIDELPDKYSYSILKVPLHVGEKSLMLDISKDRNGVISEITSDFINQEIYWQDKTVVYYTDELIKAIGYLRRKRNGLIEKHKTLLKSLETETKITIESEEYKI